jgi:arylsulfatase A-like enzyme
VQATLMDVAPTILFALGIPAARDLSGAPLTRLFNEQFVGRYPVRQVETYGQRVGGTPARGGQPLDQEMLDRLRSLGYVR